MARNSSTMPVGYLVADEVNTLKRIKGKSATVGRPNPANSAPAYMQPVVRSSVRKDDDESAYGFVEDVKPSEMQAAAYATTFGTAHQVYATVDELGGDGYSNEAVLGQGGIEASVTPTLTRQKAEQLLRVAGMRDGQFVVRPSKSHPGSYVLTVAAGGEVKNYPVEALEAPYDGLFSVICPGNRRRFQSLDHAVEFYKGQAEGIATRLTQRLLP
eukprot:m.485150 g.485150  ORF g.485150 m.485150 type:complete len:214 (-) comp23675_c0_seq1:264-905(-)